MQVCNSEYKGVDAVIALSILRHTWFVGFSALSHMNFWSGSPSSVC